MSISQVTATFKKDDAEGAPKIEVQVMDYSNLEMAKGMAAAWTTVEIDKESDSGFEKTVKVASNPGFLTWQKIAALVAGGMLAGWIGSWLSVRGRVIEE